MQDAMLRELREKLKPVFTRHGVKKAILFGSSARGSASRRSDLDIIAIKPTDSRFLDRYDGLLRDTIDAAGVPVDLLIYTPEEFESMRRRRWLASALAGGVLIHES